MRDVFWPSLAAVVLFHAAQWAWNYTVWYPMLRRRAARLVDAVAADLGRARRPSTLLSLGVDDVRIVDRADPRSSQAESVELADRGLREAADAEADGYRLCSSRLAQAAALYRQSVPAADQERMRAEYHLREAALDEDDDSDVRLASAAALYRRVARARGHDQTSVELRAPDRR